ncbi:MAG: GHKL domain-containing protein [Lachnospiraceae bacterium]|nr:GHKL domain-containing protein [Lachnospiraceae bacterium]
MTDIVLNFLICFFEVYVFYDFLRDILEERTQNKFVISTVLGIMSGFMCCINQFQISQINLIGVILLFLVGTIFLFCGSLKARISYYLIFYIIMVGMEFVVGIFFTIITSSDYFIKELYPFKYFVLVIITKLMAYMALRLIKLFLNRKEIGMRGRLLKMAFAVPVTTMLLYAGLFYANIQIEEGKVILCIGCMLLLFSNVLVFYIIEKLTYVMEQNSEYELMDLQNTLNHTYYKRMEEVEEKHKQYAHNLKEYLQTISGLVTKCKSEEIVDILKDMEVEVDSISDKIYTSNSILNTLLCEKELQAQKEEIGFHVMIEPELDLGKIKNGDIIVMVGNLIDNAIEAAALCKEEKRIDLKFFESDGNFIVLDIENTYGNRIKRKEGSYLSTKKNPLYHGIGIKSVRETAEKYGGMLFQEQKEEVFVSILTLSKGY